MKSVELFSGAGGLAKGLENSGFDHVSFVENNKNACSTLRLNFDPKLIFEGDIKDYNLSQFSNIDIVAGGPPCQPFSLGGKHKSSEDSRDMFPYAIKSIEYLKPQAFIFENVKGLLRASFSEYFSYILMRLTYPDYFIDEQLDWQTHLSNLRCLNDTTYTGTKYDVSYKLINAADYGVPQIRERVIIVGVKSDLQKKWTFPKPTHSQDRLLWDQYVSGEYWIKHGVDFNNENYYPAKIRIKDKYGVFPPESLPWQTIRDALINIPDPQDSHSIKDHIYRPGARIYPGHTGSEIDCPSKTIKAGGHGVPGGENMIKFLDGKVRYLTVFEAKILQTFPQHYKIQGAWGEAMRQIGNAVPVLLAEIIGQELFQLISKKSFKEAA